MACGADERWHRRRRTGAVTCCGAIRYCHFMPHLCSLPMLCAHPATRCLTYALCPSIIPDLSSMEAEIEERVLRGMTRDVDTHADLVVRRGVRGMHLSIAVTLAAGQDEVQLPRPTAPPLCTTLAHHAPLCHPTAPHASLLTHSPLSPSSAPCLSLPTWTWPRRAPATPRGCGPRTCDCAVRGRRRCTCPGAGTPS